MFYILIVHFVSSFCSLPVCFTSYYYHHFHLVFQCSFLDFHPVQVTSQPNECKYTSERSLPSLLLLLCGCVCWEAFCSHCHPASNVLHRSLVASNAPHTCFHIAKVGCTFSLQHLILCIGQWGYRSTTHLFPHPLVVTLCHSSQLHSTTQWVQH